MTFELTEFQKIILKIIANLNKYAIHAHFAQDQLIKKNLALIFNSGSTLFKKWKKKGLNPLIANDLVVVHSTSGHITYEITRKGLNLL